MTEEEIIKQHNIWKQKKVREKRRIQQREWRKKHPDYYKKYHKSERYQRKKREKEASNLVTGQIARKHFANKIIFRAKEFELLNKEVYGQDENNLQRFNEAKKYMEDTNES